MRRYAITALIIPSLLVAAVPAQADAAKSHRQSARTAAVHKHVAHAPGKRMSPGKKVQKYTYGRT